MNIFRQYQKIIGEIIDGLKDDGSLAGDLDASGFVVEPPREAAHGDLASNVAMVLSKRAKMSPRDLAGLLAPKLEARDDIEAVDIAGPGFINIRLNASVWQNIVGDILSADGAYGTKLPGDGAPRINVEYVSANPTGPMHVGHCRGAVFGDALAALLASQGGDITREYYINDAGGQIDVLARSVYLRYREALGEDIGEIPEGLYPGDYLVPIGKALAKEHGSDLLDKSEAEYLPKLRDASIAAMMDMIREDLAALNIHHDVFFSERDLGDGNGSRIETAIEELENRDLVYMGRLDPPKGKLPDDWEDREQLLFRSTKFGDDSDRALRKSDGSHTYFAADIAYHLDKTSRGFNDLIDVWGADHSGYIKRVKAAVAALTDGKAALDVKICQMVRLFRGGELVKMSKRSGTFVTLRELVDEVGADPVRFIMLYRKNDAPLDFDFVKVTEKSRDNPVFYVQYAHARAYSIFRNMAEIFSDMDIAGTEVRDADLSLLDDEGEIDMIKRLAQYPMVLEGAANAHEPHRVAFYLYELASDLHSQWNKGKDKPHLRFIRDDDRALTAARMALVAATAEIIKSGLKILGVSAPEEMR